MGPIWISGDWCLGRSPRPREWLGNMPIFGKGSRLIEVLCLNKPNIFCYCCCCLLLKALSIIQIKSIRIYQAPILCQTQQECKKITKTVLQKLEELGGCNTPTNNAKRQRQER